MLFEDKVTNGICGSITTQINLFSYDKSFPKKSKWF